MDSIKNHHRKLVEQKEKIIQYIYLQKRLGSALWRLSTEVLSQKIYYCLLPLYNPSPPNSFHTVDQNMPTMNGGCCDTPSLRCRLFVEVNGGDWQREAFCHASWLKRSKGRPFSLALQCYYASECAKLPSLLRPYINQVSSLCSYFRALEELTISVYTPYPEAGDHTLADPMPAVAHSISQLLSTLRNLRVIGPLFNLHHLFSSNPVSSSLAIRISSASFQTLELCTHIGLQSLRLDCPMSLHEEFKAFLTRSKCPLESLVVGGGAKRTDEQQAEYAALTPSLQF
ncbi:uncharacterized protein EDB91DRAFT_1247480 [Suillus paluster]|uniref:uncharacterized protein n=1 Tax=Suillus paluster TaxID=48578 RepID=UPI001B879AAF|nr:uncharacterized protein EDB91DRAFT_1247480 [Suillus paluster]KAG1742666.1 hypothetical protein EDB91DRAFT_1247480 [Suillus paluster]